VSELITGEAVVLDLSPARVITRGFAFAIDATVQLTLLVLAILAANAISSALGADAAITATFGLLAVLLALVGYPVLNEVLLRGRSLGKTALGLRVVRTDGGPTRVRHSLVRALFGVIELWACFGSIAFIASLSSIDGKRLGDQFAGTLVVRERTRTASTQTWVPAPWLIAWVTRADLSRVPDDLAESARQLLLRRHELDPQVRNAAGHDLASAMAAVVSPPAPPGTGAEDYLTAVLAERRRREEARLAQQHPPAPVAPTAPTSPQGPSTPPVSDTTAKPPAGAGGFVPPA
jgi:uncharacterized RDD family membrane protein YckC